MAAGPGCSACQRSPHRARPSRPSPASDSVLVTHRFHPLAGQRLAVILERRRPGAELVLVCEGGPAGRVTLPVGWTDRTPASPGHRRATDDLVAALEHQPVAPSTRS